jgi:hypothetical protein
MVRYDKTLVVLLLIASASVQPSGQSVTVYVVEDELHVRAPGSSFAFIEGAALERLQDGRALRVDFELTVLAEPGAQPVTERRQGFNLSYDLWEERFAVSLIGDPPRSVSHLSVRDAEAWCLEQLTVPVDALGRLGRDVPFWIRLAYRVQNPEPSADSDDDTGFTLLTLIDWLGRRGQDGAVGESVEAGPFRLPG